MEELVPRTIVGRMPNPASQREPCWLCLTRLLEGARVSAR